MMITKPVRDEWLDATIASYEADCWELVDTRRVYTALKELQGRRGAEKEQNNTKLPTDDKNPVETILESVKPIPVVKVDGVDVKECHLKQWLAKINEELDELKVALIRWDDDDADIAITDEAADTITAITSMLEAMGFDENQRNEAQRRVNEKNRKRGRL